MSQVAQSAALAFGLFVALLAAQYVGRWIGCRRAGRFGDGGKGGSGAVQGAVFALLGLLLAFTFTGASGRFDHRRDLVVQQVNAIGTAWMRLDLLPADEQPPLRELMRRYVDGLQAGVKRASDYSDAMRIVGELQVLQGEIWSRALAAAQQDGRPHIASLVLPPLNETFDLTSSRAAAARIHVPPGIVALLVALAVLSGLLAGHAQSDSKHPDWLHMLVFAALISATLYFILDFEYPRLGLVTVESADMFFEELRASLQ